MRDRSKQPQDIRTRTLEIAALLGREFSLPLVHAATGSTEGVHQLFEQEILTTAPDPGRGRFLKPSDAKKLEKSIPWSKQRQHFQDLGKAAQKLRFPSQEIALYFEKAQQVDMARDWWARAAKKACDGGDYANALKWLDRALTLWPWNESPDERVAMLREAARCAANSENIETCRGVWEELADYGADSGQPPLQVEALDQLARLTADAAQTSEYLKRAGEIAEQSLTPLEAAHHLLNYVEHLAERTLISIAKRVLKRTVIAAEKSEDAATISEVRGWQGLLDAMSGRHKSAGQFVEESLRIALENDLKEQAAIAYRRRANIQDYRGQYAEERESQMAAIQFCQSSKAGNELVCMACLSYACFRSGDWTEAVRSARAVLRDADESPGLKAIGSCVLGLIHAFRGERRPASNYLTEALDCFHASGFVGMEFFALWGLAYLQYSNGEMSGALETFDQIRTLWKESDDVHDVIPAMLFAGGIYAEAGMEKQLIECQDILEKVVRKNPIGEARAAVAALKAEHALLAKQSGEFHSLMKTAVDKYRPLELPIERLWVECRLAKHGPSVAKDDSHAESIALAKRLGTRPMLAILQDRASSSSSENDLTPRQSEVLRFLATGLTSKEIADRLSLSTRTVEMHVGRLLARMNCRTRPEAVRAAIERGWLQRE